MKYCQDKKFQTEIKMDIGERLKKVREFLGLTQEEFAQKLDTTQAVISNYERGARVPTVDFLNRLTKTFQLDINWLLTGEGEMFREKTKAAEAEKADYCPVAYYRELPLSAGPGTFTFEEIYPEPVLFSRSFLEQYFKTRVSSKELLLFPVDGNSMEPTIPDGSYVIVRKFEYEGLSRPKEGKIYALIYNDVFYIKRVCIRDLSDGKMFWRLLSDNRDYPPIEFHTSPDSFSDVVKIIGRVIGCIRRL